jgi:hypothetical protein
VLGRPSAQLDDALLKYHVTVRRSYVDRARLEWLPSIGLDQRQGRVASQEGREAQRIDRTSVLHDGDDGGQAWRQRGKQTPQGFDPTSGGANDDDISFDRFGIDREGPTPSLESVSVDVLFDLDEPPIFDELPQLVTLLLCLDLAKVSFRRELAVGISGGRIIP